MDILICAATSAEIQPFINHLQQNKTSDASGSFQLGPHKITVLITGVGSIATAFALSQALMAQRFQYAVQAGIAGSFSSQLQPGDVVCIEKDIMADLGAESKNGFLHLSKLSFSENLRDFSAYWVKAEMGEMAIPLPLQKATAITVNTVSGTAQTIEMRRKIYSPDIETMEGYPFHYVCKRNGIPFVQIRSISNKVEIRDKSKWNIPLALENLNRYLINLVEAL